MSKLFRNTITGIELTEEQYDALLIKEWTEQYNEGDDLETLQLKEDKGYTLEQYIKYQQQYYVDTDFKLVEE